MVLEEWSLIKNSSIAAGGVAVLYSSSLLQETSGRLLKSLEKVENENLSCDLVSLLPT